jgi:hypothetical protein
MHNNNISPCTRWSARNTRSAGDDNGTMHNRGGGGDGDGGDGGLCSLLVISNSDKIILIYVHEIIQKMKCYAKNVTLHFLHEQK